MPLADLPEIEELLAKWGAGDREALRSLIPLIYEELRKVARQQLRRAPSGTLQTTALVHEAYMRLHHQVRVQFQNKSHFIAVFALLMRQILVGYERQKRAAKRGRDALLPQGCIGFEGIEPRRRTSSRRTVGTFVETVGANRYHTVSLDDCGRNSGNRCATGELN